MPKDTPPLSAALPALISILGSVFPNLSFVQFLRRTKNVVFGIPGVKFCAAVYHSIGVPSPVRDRIPSTRGGTGPG
ncbi:hypothetical protein BZA77DRAFT_386582, partial [Pyronema omphalodes]